MVAGLPDVLDDDEVSAAVRQAIVERIRATPAAPLLARGLEVAIAEGHHRLIVDAVLARAGEYLEANRDALYQRLRTESPWWLPGAIDERIFAKIFGSAQRLVADVAADPDHELRRDIDARLVELVARLRTDPVLAARVEARKEQLLDHPDVQVWAGSVWADVKAYLLRSAREPGSVLRGRFEAALVGAGTRLRDDPSLQVTVDGWLIDAVAAVVSQYRESAADYIAATVERWDPADTADRLELVVGRDLQFIRINGTVVGGLAGLGHLPRRHAPLATRGARTTPARHTAAGRYFFSGGLSSSLTADLNSFWAWPSERASLGSWLEPNTSTTMASTIRSSGPSRNAIMRERTARRPRPDGRPPARDRPRWRACHPGRGGSGWCSGCADRGAGSPSSRAWSAWRRSRR